MSSTKFSFSFIDIERSTYFTTFNAVRQDKDIIKFRRAVMDFPFFSARFESAPD